MAPAIVSASLTGVEQIVAARYTHVAGTRPGRAIVDIAPQAGAMLTGGTLELACGGARMRLVDCRVERVAFRFSPEAAVWRLSLVDRRWRWRYGEISGRYNLRRAGGALVAGTERTPRELAQLCLAALGEPLADVSALPTAPRPQVEWNLASPARELERLTRQFDCLVTLGLDDRVRIAPRAAPVDGASADLIAGGELMALAPGPSRLAVVTAPMRFQIDLPLEAVGLDVDGETRPLDELSYRPYGGWPLADVGHFHAISDLAAREQARQSVFRWYRALMPLELPLVGAIDDLSQLAPLAAEQLAASAADPAGGNLPAVVFGVWCDYPWQATNRAATLAPLGADPRPRVAAPFELDGQRGLVKFARPVFRYGAGPRPAAAQLVLRASVTVRDPATKSWRRYVRARELSHGDGTTRYIRREELTPTVTAQYDPASYALTGAATNFDQIDAAADLTIDALAARLARRRASQLLVAGLVAAEPAAPGDRIVYRVGPAGATTAIIRPLPRGGN